MRRNDVEAKTQADHLINKNKYFHKGHFQFREKTQNNNFEGLMMRSKDGAVSSSVWAEVALCSVILYPTLMFAQTLRARHVGIRHPPATGEEKVSNFHM